MILKRLLMLFIIVSMLFFATATASAASDEYEQKLFEFRGGWVATVSNIDIPKQSDSTASSILAYKTQFLNILKVFEDYNMNAVIFQVRPINDAFYKSEINPWSRFLIGTEGTDPGWDPMEWMIAECHKRNMEFHAWLNPYRASLGVLPVTGDYQEQMNNYLKTLDDKNFAKNHPDLLIRGVHDSNNNDARILLNPAEPEVRQHIYDTIEEIVLNYDVDAIHFDDYFYNGVKNEDDPNYNEYRSQGGTLSKGDWRREQVNILIEGIHDLLEDYNNTKDEDVQFGISPAGVWAPADNIGCGARGVSGGMTGIQCGSYSSYLDLFADTRKWVKEEWIDYIMPQNYGPLSVNHPYITSWWANEVKTVDVKLYIGLAPYQYNSYNGAWPIPEMDNQMLYGYSFDTVDGFCMYSITSLKSPTNSNMIAAMNKLKERWSNPALTPINQPETVDSYDNPTISYNRNSKYIMLDISPLDTVYGYIIYRTLINESFSDSDIYDMISNREWSYIPKHEAAYYQSYRYYIKPVYKDGTVGNSYIQVLVTPFVTNSAPKIVSAKIDTSLLVVNNREWINVIGEISDENGDELEVTIKLVSSTYQREYKTTVIDGQFIQEVYLPQLTFNRAYFSITVTDGIETVSGRTFSFYAPAANYLDTIKHLLTFEILINETTENIYK